MFAVEVFLFIPEIWRDIFLQALCVEVEQQNNVQINFLCDAFNNEIIKCFHDSLYFAY